VALRGFADDGWTTVRRAAELARAGGVLTPAHLLIAITQTASFAGPPLSGELLRLDDLDENADGADGGVSTDLLAGQVMGTAHAFGERRGEATGAAHLLVAILDQASPEVAALLQRADVDRTALRARALAVLGASVDTPRLPMAELPPAGTVDRPPLPLEQLPADAWEQLVARRQRLPLRKLRTISDWHAISANEQRAVRRLADRGRLTDDQRYSLLHLHHEEVQRLAAEARPAVVPAPAARSAESRLVAKAGWRPNARRRRLIPLGWRAWLGKPPYLGQSVMASLDPPAMSPLRCRHISQETVNAFCRRTSDL
jgi:hypothetical protein